MVHACCRHLTCGLFSLQITNLVDHTVALRTKWLEAQASVPAEDLEEVSLKVNAVISKLQMMQEHAEQRASDLAQVPEYCARLSSIVATWCWPCCDAWKTALHTILTHGLQRRQLRNCWRLPPCTDATRCCAMLESVISLPYSRFPCCT